MNTRQDADGAGASARAYYGARAIGLARLMARLPRSAGILPSAPRTRSSIAALLSDGVVLDDRRIAPQRKTADAR